MDHRIDFHVHPNYSFDASREPMSDYCERAVSLGLTQICFTPHYTVVPAVEDRYGFARLDGNKVPAASNEWIDRYCEEVRAADAAYSRRGLRVFAGLEVDHDEAIHDKLVERLVRPGKLDFLLGSVHIVWRDLDIMVPREADDIFVKRGHEEFFEEYFKNVERTVDSGLFACIAHLEGYRRYGTKANPVYGDEEKMPLERLAKVFQKMAKRSMALEINLSLFRNGLDMINPVERSLAIARDCGITTVTIGSDAHRVADLALNIEKAETAVKKFGFDLLNL